MQPLLHENMPHQWTCAFKTQMLGCILVGFGVGMVLLSPLQMDRQLVQRPAINFGIVGAEQARSTLGGSRGAYAGSRGSLRRNALVWQGGSSHQAMARIDRSLRLGNLARAVLAVRASADEAAVKERLADALKIAEDCVGECAVEWDTVEELSATAADQGAPAKSESEGKLTKEDMAILTDAKQRIAQMRNMETVDLKKIEELASTAAEMKEVVKKVSEEKMAKIDAAFQAALEAAKACTEDCAVAWETVEELAEAKANEKA